MRSIILCFIVFLSFQKIASAQSADSISPYHQILKEFYYNLLKKKFISIKECNKLFYSASLEYDEFLFLENCNKTKSNNDCNELARERYSRPSTYESLLFIEFKKQKEQLTNGESNEIDSILKRIKFKSKGVIEMNFKKGSVLFTFSNPKFEDLYITDIFFLDGSSIFNYVYGSQEKHYYK